MGVLRESISVLKPVIYVGWIVAALRLVLESQTTDLNVVAMMSVYSAVLVMFLFAGFTGQLDRLVWKPLVPGVIFLVLACWFVPNTISYGVAQFQEWNHGRFHVDSEHWAIQQKHMDQGMGYFDSLEKADEELGRKGETRGPPPADTTAGKLKTAVTAGALTSIGGLLWCLVLATLFVGFPASVRRRRAG